jgi:hypothetical protein
MLGNLATAASESRDALPRAASPRPDTAALVEGLDRLRDSLFEQLDQIEARAQEQSALLQVSPTEREQALRERVAILEATQARLHAESKRREHEWNVLLEQLESDRQLIAKAWERLEQEQVDAAPGQAQASRTADPERATVAPTAFPPPQADPPEDAVTKAILRQFQSLQSDVRRNAKERKGR